MRVGIFGGTFDPPHLGHLIVAADALVALDLDRVVWIPSAVPPHKRSTVQAPAALRLALVRAAVDGDHRFAVDGLELERPGPSYTVDTLRDLHRRAPEDELFFLIGADNLRDLASWKEPEEIVRVATLAVLSRGGELPALGALPAVAVPVTRIDISATEIRRRVAAGRCIRYLVPERVHELIAREGIYKNVSLSETSC